MKRFVCIHGHFYQPPRENPWLEAVELQDSAYPYHDWNQRISVECYAANAAARILDSEGRIERIVSTYERISFNFGPTLLAWLERHDPATYDAILAADEASRRRFSGHGSALAQGYGHMILPLASRADKVTQVRWGLADFVRRFRRQPEGMWLPETAVNVETLEVLAEAGIRFTVLAPHQAARVRRAGERDWHDVGGGRVDTTMPYTVVLPSGRRIPVFFYDGPISRAIAFERLLERGENLVGRLRGAFRDGGGRAELVHIATDGETYGHHHRFGEMALAYALDVLERDGSAQLTNYGEFLERFPPDHEAEIVERTSWSCAHGVERWRSDCGCSSGHPGWNQAWRGPLRAAFDWLRDELAAPWAERAGALLRDPHAARDDYIAVVLDRSPAAAAAFLSRHATRPLDAAEGITALKLLEMQRHLMLMYTSCGWFFDDVSGIETVQVISYAARAVQLAAELFGGDLEERFLARLETVVGNRREAPTARAIYESEVRPAVVDLPKVAAHVAVSSLFDGDDNHREVFCYGVEVAEEMRLETGRLRLTAARLRVLSRITHESADFDCAALHFGDHNLSCGVRPDDEAAHRRLAQEAREAFARADVPEVIRLLDRHFPPPTYSLKSLFRDEQRRILNTILAASLRDAESEYGRLFANHGPLMRFLASLDVPLPRVFASAAELVLNGRLRRELEAERPDSSRVLELISEARDFGVALEGEGLGFALQQTLERLAAQVHERPDDLPLLQALVETTGLVPLLPFEVRLWRVQNLYWELRAAAGAQAAGRGDAGARAWLSALRKLGATLNVAPPGA
jgi:alpha-amylase/alpha-mannosidase (GH57 family)